MAARLSDEQVDALERRLASDNQGDASDLADEARRARESEAALRKALKAAERILWMAEKYAEDGGSGGPEMRDYTEAIEEITTLKAKAGGRR